jgi:hypothetical protein
MLRGYVQQTLYSPWATVPDSQLMSGKNKDQWYSAVLQDDPKYARWLLQHSDSLTEVSLRNFARYLMQMFAEGTDGASDIDPRGTEPLRAQRAPVYEAASSSRVPPTLLPRPPAPVPVPHETYVTAPEAPVLNTAILKDLLTQILRENGVIPQVQPPPPSRPDSPTRLAAATPVPNGPSIFMDLTTDEEGF